MEQEATTSHTSTTDFPDWPIVMVATDGSNRIFVVRDDEGQSYYYTPLAGWRRFDDVPMKDVPPDDASAHDRWIGHDPLWWPDAAAALLMVKAIGKYL